MLYGNHIVENGTFDIFCYWSFRVSTAHAGFQSPTLISRQEFAQLSFIATINIYKWYMINICICASIHHIYDYVRIFTHERLSMNYSTWRFQSRAQILQDRPLGDCKIKRKVVPDPTGQVSAQVVDTKRQEVILLKLEILAWGKVCSARCSTLFQNPLVSCIYAHLETRRLAANLKRRDQTPWSGT